MLAVRGLGAYVYRTGRRGDPVRRLGQLGAELGAGLLDPHLAYLTGDDRFATPFATAYAVQRPNCPSDRQVLRRWVAEHRSAGWRSSSAGSRWTRPGSAASSGRPDRTRRP